MTPYEFMTQENPELVPADKAAAFLRDLSEVCNKHRIMFCAQYSDATEVRILPDDIAVTYAFDEGWGPVGSKGVYAIKPLLNGEDW